VNLKASAETARQTVSRLALEYGQDVLLELKSEGASCGQIEEAFYRTFLSALQQMETRRGRKLFHRNSRFQVLTTAKNVFAALKTTESQPSPWFVTHEKDSVGNQEDRNLPSLADLQIRLDKLLKAAYVEAEALRQHKGPGWTRYAVILTLVVAAGAIVFGVFDKSAQSGSSAGDGNDVSKSAASFPTPLRGLPVDVTGQLAMKTTSISITHLAVTRNAAYLPEMEFDKAGNATAINIYQSLFANGTLVTAGNPFAKVKLKPPAMASSASAGSGAPVKPSDWHFAITGSWAVVILDWPGMSSKVPNSQVSQVYLVNLNSGAQALTKTFSPQAGGAVKYTITAAQGRVAVQGVLPNTGQAASAVLPVTVYQLGGSNPAKALTKSVVLSNAGGQLVNPVILPDGIISQGYQGQSPSPDDLYSTWYLLDWQNGITEEMGPPLDGRPHWAVYGDTRGVWWVETTPSGQGSGAGLQVLMASLSSTSAANQLPASSLNGTVAQLHVGDGYLEWVQDTANVPQLVVARVQ